MLEINIEELIRKVAGVGQKHHLRPDLQRVKPFQGYFQNGSLAIQEIDNPDDECTRREVLLRYLLLLAVLDQGPDVEGVRHLLVDVTNGLYDRNVKFLHQPSSFFSALSDSIEQVRSVHEDIKNKRSEQWAHMNDSKAEKYSLFLDNAHQILNYVMFRWGVPLSLPLLLDLEANGNETPSEALYAHLSEYESAERMSQGLKSDEMYGLGKAIGNKACHLFAKWTTTSFRLLGDSRDEWGDFSYEAPLDSNAGRVLWRTGYFLHWADLEYYQDKRVLQSGGKGGTTYIRVTNIRGLKPQIELPSDIRDSYNGLCVNHLKVVKRKPESVAIQRIPGAYLLRDETNKYTVEDFDDGLMHVGTTYCFNHGEPKCTECPLKSVCYAHQKDQSLIEKYRT